jgi:hypothetical protein
MGHDVVLCNAKGRRGRKGMKGFSSEPGELEQISLGRVGLGPEFGDAVVSGHELSYRLERIASRRSGSVGGRSPRCSMRWQLEQTTARSSSRVVRSPAAWARGILWWHSM